MTYRATILGCGSSGGVPRVGTGWGTCDPAEPRNRRRRCSLLVERMGEGGTTAVLIDTAPDLREQLIDAQVTRLDAVLYTHEHADHTHGIDDLRGLVLANRKRVPVYCDLETSISLLGKFGYCFATPAGSDYPPILTEHRIADGERVTIDGPGGPITFLPFEVDHGTITALGFRIGGFAYSPDVVDVPERSLPAISGLDIWVVDALRQAQHPSHFSLSDALVWIERMRPGRAVLTNMHNDLDYRRLCASLPAGVMPAYDGYAFAFDGDARRL